VNSTRCQWRLNLGLCCCLIAWSVLTTASCTFFRVTSPLSCVWCRQLNSTQRQLFLMYPGPSFSRSCIFQPCDLIRHFPALLFSVFVLFWSAIFRSCKSSAPNHPTVRSVWSVPSYVEINAQCCGLCVCCQHVCRVTFGGNVPRVMHQCSELYDYDEDCGEVVGAEGGVLNCCTDVEYQSLKKAPTTRLLYTWTTVLYRYNHISVAADKMKIAKRCFPVAEVGALNRLPISGVISVNHWGS